MQDIYRFQSTKDSIVNSSSNNATKNYNPWEDGPTPYWNHEHFLLSCYSAIMSINYLLFLLFTCWTTCTEVIVNNSFYNCISRITIIASPVNHYNASFLIRATLTIIIYYIRSIIIV